MGGTRCVGVLACVVVLAGAIPPTGGSAQTSRSARVEGDLVEEATTRRQYPIRVAPARIQVDGVLDDAGWDGALGVELPHEVRPAENGTARVTTACRMTYDADALYIGCEAADPDPGRIRAYVADRDGIDGHDRVVVTLDPFNDQRRAFQFGISALGVQYDAVMAQQGVGGRDDGPDAQPVDPSWDAIWDSSGRITDEGYVVEAAIPFSALRFPTPAGPATWGVYVSRWWPRSTDTELRSVPWDRSNSCELCQAGEMTGLEGITPGANIQLTPTLTTSRTDRRPADGGALTTGDTDASPGMDAQWGVTSNLTLNVTANPDFSQVEADVAQLDVNNRFALFFPEKRPFFLEGADFFGTPIQAVFTRAISDPIAGAKVTGKVGDHAVGALVARDAVTNLLMPGAEFSRSTSLDASSTTAVARLRTDIGASSTVGGLFTSRDARGYHNRVGGFDAFYRPRSSVTLQAQALRSDTRYPDAVASAFDQPTDAFGGNAFSVQADWTTRNWMANASASRTDEGFRADAGFVSQSGRQGGNANVRRRWWGGSDRWFSQIRAQVGTWHNRDFLGNQLDGGMWMGLEYFGPGQTHVGIWPNLFMKQYFAGTEFTGITQLFFNASAAPVGALSVNFGGDWGDQVDQANARLGRQLTLRPRVSLRLGRKTDLSLQYSHQRMTRDGGTVFGADLTQLRAVYNFSVRSYLRAVVQYRDTERDAALYTRPISERSRTLFTQLLYSYKLNPQTVLFAGYSDDRDGLIDAQGRDVPLRPLGRTFFLKLGYAFRP